jgi:hypothetical protein
MGGQVVPGKQCSPLNNIQLHTAGGRTCITNIATYQIVSVDPWSLSTVKAPWHHFVPFPLACDVEGFDDALVLPFGLAALISLSPPNSLFFLFDCCSSSELSSGTSSSN